MTVHLWIPAVDEAEARSIAHAVNAGRCGHREHYETVEAAQRIADHLNRLARADGRAIRRTVFPVTLRAVDDGVIANVWPNVEQIGEAVAAMALVIGGTVIAGLATLL